MKRFKLWLVFVILVFFVMNLVTLGFGAEAPGIKPKDIKQLRPEAAGKIEAIPQVYSGPPDLAVIDFFVDNNCTIKFTLKNKGGSFSSPNNMQVDLCLNGRGCVVYSIAINALKTGGGQETFPVPTAVKNTLLSMNQQPITIKIDPVAWLHIPDNPLNNSLTKDLKCVQQ